jgi:hypothetical protein
MKAAYCPITTGLIRGRCKIIAKFFHKQRKRNVTQTHRYLGQKFLRKVIKNGGASYPDINIVVRFCPRHDKIDVK